MMGAIIGAIVGYAMGTRAGAEGWEELVDACRVIAQSEELRDMITGGASIAKDLLGRSNGVLADLLGEGKGARALRPAT